MGRASAFLVALSALACRWLLKASKLSAVNALVDACELIVSRLGFVSSRRRAMEKHRHVTQDGEGNFVVL